MQITININVSDRIVHWFTRPWLLGSAVVAIGTATAFAVTDPGDFQNGTPIDANIVNNRFKALYTAVNNLESGASWTVGQGNAISYTGGNVGINTAAPKGRLHVVGSTILGSADEAQGKLSIKQDTDVPTAGIYLLSSTNANCRMWVQPVSGSCNVGAEAATKVASGGSIMLCAYCD